MIVRELRWHALGDGAKLRVPAFAVPSSLALEDAGAVANAVAERVRHVFDRSVAVDVFPPAALGEGMWERLSAGARVYALQGERADATLAIDREDAARIASAALGEPEPRGERLSRIESFVVDRFAAELIPALEPLCGSARFVAFSTVRLPANYLRVRLGEPVHASLGIAVAAAAAPAPVPGLSPSALDGCELECRAQLGRADVDLLRFAELNVGDVLRLDTKVGPSATLNLGPDPIAAGEGGILGDRTAFQVHEVYRGATS